VLIRERTCKVAEVSTSETGRPGHAETHVVALDISAGKEDPCPTLHSLGVPLVKRTEYPLLNTDTNTGSVT